MLAHVAMLGLALAVLFVPGRADAGRKRVVVLELDGPKAEKFHDDLVKLLKKGHTVVPTEKWMSTAEDLGADKLTDGNVKKVAKKLKIDAVITGKVEKRRDEYILQLKVRSGASGAIVGQRIDTSSEGPRIDAKASKDLKDELVGAIATMKSGKGGDDEEEAEEEEDRPKKKRVAKKDEEEEEEEEEEPKLSKKELAAQKKKEEAERKKKEKEEEEERKAEAERKKEEERKKKEDEKKKKVAKKDEEEEEEESEEEDRPKKFSKKKETNAEEDDTAAALKTKKDGGDEEEEEEDDGDKKKKVAARDGDEDEGEVSAEADGDADAAVAGALTPGERAVDAVLGLSFNARRLKFKYNELENHPPPYNGVPVAGAILDVTVFPFAFGHKNKSMLKNIGISLMYDRVLLINSKSDPDGEGGNAPVTLPTSQQRYAIGGLFRYPIGKITLAGGIDYTVQSFTIEGAMGVAPGIPNVKYKVVEPTVSAKFMATDKIVIGLSAAYMKINSTGQMQNSDQYGKGSVNGVELELGVDYQLTKNLFARVGGRYERIGFTFTGSGTMSTMRDDDPEQDVYGASDSYFGGIATVGYLY